MKRSSLWEAFLHAWDTVALMEGTLPRPSKRVEDYRFVGSAHRDRDEHHDEGFEGNLVIRWG